MKNRKGHAALVVLASIALIGASIGVFLAIPARADMVIPADAATRLAALEADGAVTNADLAADAVTSEKIADDAVTNEHLAADCVTGAELADDAVDSEHITDGAVDVVHVTSTGTKTGTFTVHAHGTNFTFVITNGLVITTSP